MIGHLVLSRKKGQSVFIGDAKVRIKQVRGTNVVLCISAPEQTRILREEVKEEWCDGDNLRPGNDT